MGQHFKNPIFTEQRHFLCQVYCKSHILGSPQKLYLEYTLQLLYNYTIACFGILDNYVSFEVFYET